jgi:hypothetical protein
MLSKTVKTSTRCMPWQLPQLVQQGLFKSMSQAANEQTQATPAPKPLRRPKMVSAGAAAALLKVHSQYSDAAAAAASCG